MEQKKEEAEKAAEKMNEDIFEDALSSVPKHNALVNLETVES